VLNLIDFLRSKTWACLFVIYTRYLIGAAYVYAGWGKALGGRFMPAGALQLPPDHGVSIDLFFETLYRTGIWWQSLGTGQALAGALLMTQRFSTLGAVAFLPVSLNIFLITISMDFHYTWTITSLMLVANLGLLLWDHAKLRPLLSPNRNGQLTIWAKSDQLGMPRYWQGLGLLLLLTSLSFSNRENVPLWFLLCFVESVAGGIIFWVLNKRQGRVI
jgi:hypothetical protein